MEHIDFALWMILFPLSSSLTNYFDYKVNPEGDTKITPNIAFIMIAIYVVVGYLIF